MDTPYAPYGEKPDEFIRARSLALAERLAQRGAKLLVVACNTATTHAISYLRSRLTIPIIGVEPGIKPAVQVSGSKVVGVLATAATLRSQRLQALLSDHDHVCRFICQAGHGLVELIEQGKTAGSSIEALLDSYLTPMIADGADTLVLGSTHYGLLIPSIKRVLGDQLNLIETPQSPGESSINSRLTNYITKLIPPTQSCNCARRHDWRRNGHLWQNLQRCSRWTCIT